MFSDGLLGPLFAIFATEIGGDVLDITIAWAIFMIVTGVLTIYFGKLGDTVGHEKLLVLGYALNAVFTFAFLFIDTAFGLFIVQAGLGVSLALANPTWFALYDKYSENKKDGYLWGKAKGQGNIATGVAAIVGGYIVSATSFKVLFIIMGILQTIASIIQFRILRSKEK
jgi:MFS family permease